MANEKDIAEKTLQSFNDVFADIVNVLLFEGRQIIRPEELEQARARSSYAGEERLREQERDEAKFWRKEQIRISLLGLENETEPEPDMPLRVIGYDGAGYRDQIYSEKDENGNYVRNHKRRYPVVTLVLYFGLKPWNEARTLYENLGEMDEEVRPYVNDYGVNLFPIAWLSDEQVSMFRSDFRIVADYFTQMRKTGTYVGSKDDFDHVQEVLQLMTYLTKDERFRETYEETKNLEGAVKNMCEVLDRIENRGLQRGMQQGIQQGLQRGRESERLASLNSLKETLGLTNEQAMKALKIPATEQAKYLARLKQ